MDIFTFSHGQNMAAKYAKIGRVSGLDADF